MPGDVAPRDGVYADADGVRRLLAAGTLLPAGVTLVEDDHPAGPLLAEDATDGRVRVARVDEGTPVVPQTGQAKPGEPDGTPEVNVTDAPPKGRRRS